MQVPCDEGVAIHIGPESCAVAREDLDEALTGVRVGQPLSRESFLFRVPTPCLWWKADDALLTGWEFHHGYRSFAMTKARRPASFTVVALSSRVNFRRSSRERASRELGMALAPVTLLFIGNATCVDSNHRDKHSD